LKLGEKWSSTQRPESGKVKLNSTSRIRQSEAQRPLSSRIGEKWSSGKSEAQLNFQNRAKWSSTSAFVKNWRKVKLNIFLQFFLVKNTQSFKIYS
jgi:hypothetical protein